MLSIIPPLLADAKLTLPFLAESRLARNTTKE
jgi:hypothetical protein